MNTEVTNQVVYTKILKPSLISRIKAKICPPEKNCIGQYIIKGGYIHSHKIFNDECDSFKVKCHSDLIDIYCLIPKGCKFYMDGVGYASEKLIIMNNNDEINESIRYINCYDATLTIKKKKPSNKKKKR